MGKEGGTAESRWPWVALSPENQHRTQDVPLSPRNEGATVAPGRGLTSAGERHPHRPLGLVQPPQWAWNPVATGAF